jgi:hypothetical protein
MMPREQCLELAPKVDIDPTQQDRRHERRVSRSDVATQAPLLGSARWTTASSPSRAWTTFHREQFARSRRAWHGWQYDVRTGQNEFDLAIQLQTYDVQVEDGEVRVRV